MERASSSNQPALDDAFGMLGLPEQFDLDPKTIEQAYFDRSKELHPDRFASAPPAERVAALSRSRALNDAYKVLKKPVSRAEYLLARAGIKIGENERLDDAAFLMEILELREELAQARGAAAYYEQDHAMGNTSRDLHGPGSPAARVQELCDDMNARHKAVVDTLPALFQQKDLPAIKKQLIVLRYLDRYLEECNAALDED